MKTNLNRFADEVSDIPMTPAISAAIKQMRRRCVTGLLFKIYDDGDYDCIAQGVPDASPAFVIKMLQKAIADLRAEESQKTGPNKLILAGSFDPGA